MEDESIIKNYGNKNIPAGTLERPLVTFAVFAYNQEKYIREAVEGAFSQTYSPLEIILSDDCSTDHTFDIMEQMAREYQGTHLVRLRRGKRNLGIIDHVISVARIAKGELMVVGAGDDYSFENRVERITELWVKSRADAIYSGSVDVDDAGNVIRQENIPEPLDRIQDLFRDCVTPIRYEGKVRNIPGYSAAYKRDILAELPLSDLKIHNEDALTTYLINLNGGGIEVCRTALLARRISLTSISPVPNQKTIEDINRNEDVIQKFSRSTRDFIDYFCNFVPLPDNEDVKKVKSRLLSEREYFSVVANFWELSPIQRFLALFKGGMTTRFVMPRLVGKFAFLRVKWVINRIRYRS